MTGKALNCIPVFSGLLVSLVLQMALGAVGAGWLMWWIARNHDDGVEPLDTLIGCFLTLAIWGVFAAFTASVGVYGTIRRKRFMKQFWKTEAFVWICHIGIGVWSIIVYYRVIKDEKVQDCRDKIKEDSDDESVELCRDLLSFRGAPLPYIWATSIVETVIQTVALYFLWHWRALLNEYKIVDQEDVPNKSIGGGHVHMPKSEQQGLLGNSSESKFMLPAPVKSMYLGQKPIV